MFKYKKLTHKEHFLYHFKSLLDEFQLVDFSNKSSFAETFQVLIEKVSNGLNIPYPILLKYLYGGNNDEKTDEQS